MSARHAGLGDCCVELAGRRPRRSARLANGHHEHLARGRSQVGVVRRHVYDHPAAAFQDHQVPRFGRALRQNLDNDGIGRRYLEYGGGVRRRLTQFEGARRESGADGDTRRVRRDNQRQPLGPRRRWRCASENPPPSEPGAAGRASTQAWSSARTLGGSRGRARAAHCASPRPRSASRRIAVVIASSRVVSSSSGAPERASQTSSSSVRIS